MKISNEQLNTIISNAKAMGYDVRVRDIVYFTLKEILEDKELAFKVVFGDGKIEDYEKKEASVVVGDSVNALFKQEKGLDISFEENKAYMLELKSKTEKAMEIGEIDKKDALKILTDISVKLNDKFQVQTEVKEQMVIVQKKYDDVCSYCSHEVARKPISKEEAMVMYNLIEKK